jgi:ubiquinol-cytochrome c reductase cytochrome b subunit
MFDRFLIWLDDRSSIPTLAHKIRHWSVPRSGSYARLLPAMIIFTFFIQAITGVLLWTFYSPSAQSAWESLYYMQFVLPGGWLIRGIHHFAAQLMPIMLGFYLLGLVFTGRYRPPREFVFWTAFVLFLFSLGSSLTGDLLSWTLSGFSATLVRVRFLQMIPFVGEPLFRIVCGGAEFGTLTIPRFLVLHILVMAGGSFVLMVLWRFFDYQAANNDSPATTGQTARIPLFSNEILKYSLASLFVMAVVLLLVYRMPILNKVAPDVFTINENLPREAMLGVHLGAPADPASFYDAARPEWSFRSIYHFVSLKIKGADGIETDVFPGEKKYIPVFVVTSCIAAYIFLIPLIGRLFVGHCLNVLVVAALFVSICYLTYASYHHDYLDPSMQSFRDDEAAAARQAERAIELCLSTGIPPTGALTLLQNDPFTQGPVLYKQHCAICHPFTPQEGASAHPDFKPIPCDTPKAPNLYNPIRKEWIAGFLDPQKINSADYFANTKFAAGSMVGFVRGDMKDAVKDAEDMGTENALDRLVDFLLAEAKRDFPRGPSEPVAEEINDLFSFLTCGQCHSTYEPGNKPVIQAPDLRGYLSRDWLMGIISDPESKRFYGPPVAGKSAGNDAMPAYYKNAEEAVLSMEEIGILTDWLRENWHRYLKVTPAEESMQPVK